MKSIDEAPTKEKENKSMEALHELITNVQFANDEGDSGGYFSYQSGAGWTLSSVRVILFLSKSCAILLSRPNLPVW